MATEAHEAQAEIRGIGHSVRRKEDARFIRGRGNYIDDIHLPGMQHASRGHPRRDRRRYRRPDGSTQPGMDADDVR